MEEEFKTFAKKIMLELDIDTDNSGTVEKLMTLVEEIFEDGVGLGMSIMADDIEEIKLEINEVFRRFDFA